MSFDMPYELEMSPVSFSDAYQVPSSREKFEELFKTWYRETGMLSMTVRKISHPAFLKIVAMKEDALPFIFEKLSQDKGQWIDALNAIVDRGPALTGSKTGSAREAWLAWGVDNGYC